MAIGWIYTISLGDGVVRYVGRTQAGVKERLRTHVYHAKKQKNRVHRWLHSNKDRLVIEVVEEVNLTKLAEREHFWYWHFLNSGHPLLNIAPGGGCVPNNKGRVHSEEFRQKRVQIMTGKRLSEATRKKMSASQMGRPSNCGQHVRWHVNRSIQNPNCSYCQENQ